MNIAHSACRKKIRGVAFGESFSAGDTGKCDLCGKFYIEGDSVIFLVRGDKEAYERVTTTPTTTERTKSWDFLTREERPEDLASALLPKVVAGLKGLLPDLLKDLASGAVQEIAREELRKAGAPLTIQIGDLPATTLEAQHKRFPLLLKALIAGTNPWLAGPSGSGKTTAAMNAAKALKIPFRYTGAVTDSYGLLGFRDARGEYQKTPFREAWESGGVFLWDEIDASDPNALLAFNAALANGTCAFPDGTVTKHPGCFIIAAANTWGHGATNEYVGRNKIDAAFLKRFAFIEWDYDEDLERTTCTNKEWCARVQQVRANVRRDKIRVLVTPRETYIGERLLAAGCTIEETEEMTIRSGMSKEQWDKVKPVPTPGKSDWSGMKDAEIKRGRGGGPSVSFDY